MLCRRTLRVGACVAVLGVLAWSGLGVLVAQEAKAPQGKDAVVTALQALQKAVTSYTASGKGTMTMGENTFEQTLAVVAKAPGKFKVTATSDRGERTTLCDGKTSWVPGGRDGGIRSIDRAAVAKALGIEDVASLYLPRDPVDLANPLLALNADAVKYTGTQKLGDADVYVFEGPAKWGQRGRGEDQTFFWPKMKLMIGVKDGMLRSVTTYNREGAEASVVTYTDVKVNAAVEDSVFAFKAPEGVTVQDATQTTIEQLKAAIEAAKKPAAPAA